MQAVPLVFSKPLMILPARGTRPKEKKINGNVFLKKVIPRTVRQI